MALAKNSKIEKLVLGNTRLSLIGLCSGLLFLTNNKTLKCIDIDEEETKEDQLMYQYSKSRSFNFQTDYSFAKSGDKSDWPTFDNSNWKYSAYKPSSTSISKKPVLCLDENFVYHTNNSLHDTQLIRKKLKLQGLLDEKEISEILLKNANK